MSVHPAVCAVIVGTPGGAMTLGAQGHGFFHRESGPRRQFERHRLPGLMAGGAFQVAVLELKTSMKRHEVFGFRGDGSHVNLCVTGFAANAS